MGARFNAKRAIEAAAAFSGKRARPIIVINGAGGAVTLDRKRVEDAVELLIGLLDAVDPDPDLELAGDETDGTDAEDEILSRAATKRVDGPGCKISDPDSAVDDMRCDEPFQDIELDEGVLRPTYGVDQTKGPINEVEATNAHMRRLHRGER